MAVVKPTITEDLIRGLRRYQPFVAAVVALVLVAVLLPGRNEEEPARVGAGGPAVEDRAAEESAAVTDQTVATDGGAAGPGGGAAGGPGTVAVGTTPVTGGGVPRSAQEVTEEVTRRARSVRGAVRLVANTSECDPVTGRIKVPSVYAPACMPPQMPDTGNYGRGVTRDKVRIAVYLGKLDPATGPILQAAGANDTDEDREATYRDYNDYFSKHYATWGRQVELVFIRATGKADDVAAASADAQRVIDANVFAVLNGPTDTNVFMQKVTEAGIICVCTVSQPIETYLRHAPYVWSGLMASTQLYVHRAEYVCRLWGKPAVHAGQADFRTRTRKFGFVYFESGEGVYRQGAQFFLRRVREQCGAEIPVVWEVVGAHTKTVTAQRQAGEVAQDLKNKGVTSVIFAGDPLYPIFLTKEATQKLYFPEWIITGSVLSDTTFFGRLYDQEQWQHAFGVSSLAARIPEEMGEAFRIHKWHFNGREPTADAEYGLIYAPMWILYTGLHMAGPGLNAFSFRDGLFTYPPGGGGPTHPQISFGKRLWPWPDYLAFDDMAEIWWDRSAQGEDEIGQRGTGMYRYVDGGKRYLPGRWPKGDPKVFVTEGTVTVYEDGPPPGDRWPDYPHRSH